MPTLLKDLIRLDGRVAMITGGARHLGYDMAEALSEFGCDLVVTSRTLPDAEAAAERLSADLSHDVLPLCLDVTDADAVASAVRQATEFKGHLDILVNNAGGGFGIGECHLFKRSPANMRSVVETNLLGSLYCAQQAAMVMAEQEGGSIINIASMAGFIGRDRRMYDRSGLTGQPVDYAAAKGGVIGMTLDLAGLLSPMGIRVNAISPGGFGPRGHPETFVADYANRTPLGRMGRDGVDLKGAVVFLASDASAYVTGHNLVVDGGFSIWH
jgi:NAD(P)-dependent dehydrogenase (short-subunit alcohol dehydrogenase family)